MATWNVSVPVEDTKKFVNETSFGGFGLEFRKEFKPKTTVGILGSWEVFHERRSGTIELGSAAISGVQDRYINSFPIMLSLHRYFGATGATQPYIGVAAGGFVLIQSCVGWRVEDDVNWGGARSRRLVPDATRPSSSTGATTSHYRAGLDGNDWQLTYWSFTPDSAGNSTDRELSRIGKPADSAPCVETAGRIFCREDARQRVRGDWLVA